MRIFVDQAISQAQPLFSPLGVVRLFDGRTLTPAHLREADALIVRSVTPVNAALLAGSPVRFVGTATSGVDHIDTAHLAAAGIHLADAAGSNSRAVAEYVLAAALWLAESRSQPPQALTIGIIGLGRIGAIVRAWAGHLGFCTLACDPPLADRGAPGLCPFEQLTDSADILTLHVPLTTAGPHATCEMVREPWLARLRPGAALINTSRGGVIREPDLAAALDDGRIAHAILDVWQAEPRIRRDLAEKASIATPHIAGYTVESKQRAARMIRDQLAAWLSPQPASATDTRTSSGGGYRSGSAIESGAGVPARPNQPSANPAHPDAAAIPPALIPPNPVAARHALLSAVRLLDIDHAFRSALTSPDPAAAFDRLRAACATRHELP